ncbi:hypothetical protein [Halomonas sp. E19]|uniref:hypothetical protein n=1 Tax=Halomonas sp. E19 TaxID=3397247 RepID=UPI00403477DE
MLPSELLRYTLVGRIVLMLGLVAVLLLAYTSGERIRRIRFSAGMLLALPAGFYLLVLLMLPPDQAQNLVGYGFIPFLLVAALSVFPSRCWSRLRRAWPCWGCWPFRSRWMPPG